MKSNILVLFQIKHIGTIGTLLYIIRFLYESEGNETTDWVLFGKNIVRNVKIPKNIFLKNQRRKSGGWGSVTVTGSWGRGSTTTRSKGNLILGQKALVACHTYTLSHYIFSDLQLIYTRSRDNSTYTACRDWVYETTPGAWCDVGQCDSFIHARLFRI